MTATPSKGRGFGKSKDTKPAPAASASVPTWCDACKAKRFAANGRCLECNSRVFA